ncbi:coiled-coil domain-containing protein-domain-containing protein [Cercophora samala]|uniref:Coiled-coil domain-containing protein-domain-containing protein n=1 Tax=Cercophora samala TaxID=330535 RepID=A0AA39Z841_9PEZI|nr:coiled-coil domain-containing protein-domain-containing protein [Cercophora samala]
MAPILPPSAQPPQNTQDKMHPEEKEDDVFSRPRPRPKRSPSELARLQVQNRRREYLSRNPSYFELADHELSDPLLHDHLIRRFLTPSEREADSKQKGYARVLEGSLLRGEERLAKLSSADPPPPGEEVGGENGVGVGRGKVVEAAGTGFTSFTAELLPPPKTKEEGVERWREFLRDRFIRGEDEDFEYEKVDDMDEFDELERREREEEWIEGEEPGWVGSEDEGGGRVERVLKGETGVQDF